MFTGIIRNLGTISAIVPSEKSSDITIATPLAASLQEGDSVAVNGVCLTVLHHDTTTWQARLMNETLERTMLGQLTMNSLVNLELPMRLSDRLDGHFVQGHVDGTGKILDIKKVGGDTIMTVSISSQLQPFIIPKGSISLQGVSLTVVEIKDNAFSVSLMPYTVANTAFQKNSIGDTLNIEVDMLGKYVASLLKVPSL